MPEEFQPNEMTIPCGAVDPIPALFDELHLRIGLKYMASVSMLNCELRIVFIITSKELSGKHK
jgi:hypothetical protein